MKIARFTYNDEIAYGVVDGDDLVVLKTDPLFGGFDTTGRRVALDEVRLLSPVIPRSKIVGIGMNYPAVGASVETVKPPHPVMFLVPNTAVIGPDDPIVLPAWDDEVQFEAELAVVISRPCKDVPVRRANEVIFGYTVANDVTARTALRQDVTWARAKSFDTSCPLGPYLVLPDGPDEFDPANAAIRCYVDGELRQEGNSRELIFTVPELVSQVSAMCSLLPGDVILTGTPAGAGLIEHGQRVECEIVGIGELSNPVLRR